MPSGIYKNPKRGPNGKQLRGIALASPGTRARVAVSGGKAMQSKPNDTWWDYWEARWASPRGVEARTKRR